MAVGIGIVLSVCALLFSYDVYRDVSHVYAYYAREIACGNFAEGWVGRVPMLQILMAGGISALGINAYVANIFISSLFYVCTLFPLRSYLQRYLTPLQAAWGCVLFVTAPKLIRFSVSGLIDSSRYFFLIVSLLYLFRLVEKRDWKDCLLLGLGLAGLSVSRGECVVLAPLFLMLIPVLACLTQHLNLKEIIRKYSLITLLSSVVWLAGIFPFCAVNYHYSGVFITDVRLAEAFCPWVRVNEPSEKAAVSWGDSAMDALNDSMRGGYELYLLLGVLGIILLIHRRKWRWDYSLFIFIYLLHLGIYFKIVSAYRYSIYLIPLLMPFTVTGIAWLIEKYRSWQIPRRYIWCNYAAVGVVSALLVFQVINGMRCVTDRDDVWKRKIAGVMKEWGEKNVPDRRLRVVGVDLSEAVFWSGAYNLFNYKDGKSDLRTVRDFDLMLIPLERVPEIAERNDLEPIELPEDRGFCLFRRITVGKGTNTNGK